MDMLRFYLLLKIGRGTTKKLQVTILVEPTDGLNKRMNKLIEDLQRYIETGSMPGSYSPFLEDCKDVYNEKCQEFKAMLD